MNVNSLSDGRATQRHREMGEESLSIASHGTYNTDEGVHDNDTTGPDMVATHPRHRPFNGVSRHNETIFRVWCPQLEEFPAGARSHETW